MTGPGLAGAVTEVVVGGLAGGTIEMRADRLATEEPLEIRLTAGGETRPVATTMRTPGNDHELAAGFLMSEGLISSGDDIRGVSHVAGMPGAGLPGVDFPGDDQDSNVVVVELARPDLPDLAGFERHGTVSSACGVCGRASLDRLRARGVTVLPRGRPRVDVEVLYRLPDALRAAQGTFDATGGLHAAGLFGSDGTLVCVREDVGRHNAVDKVLGRVLLDRLPPLDDHVLMVSGRAGFEIVEKAVAAGIAVVCAVSAPTSLAMATAEEFGATLVGFLRGRTANVYSGPDRILTG